MESLALTKLYYSIGEVSDMFGVAASLIRYWESEFVALHPAKNNKGERKYTAKDIETLSKIYHLVKERGFTIEGAKKELETQKQDDKKSVLLLKKLKEIRKSILDLKEELDKT